jgi:YD repeat-containing protein
MLTQYTPIFKIKNYPEADDEIGNLVTDKTEEIDTIRWTVYGKIWKVIRTTTSTKADLEFQYDASRRRVLKIEKPRNASTKALRDQSYWNYTYYTYDASGNVMATYYRNFLLLQVVVQSVALLKERRFYYP